MTGTTNGPVVVGIDGTPDGRRALQFGIELATTYDVTLRLVHVRHENVVVSPMLPLFPEPTLDEIANQVLHVAIGDVRRMGWRGAEPETVLARPPRVAALVDHARDASFLVLGTRHAQARHLLVGSTTNGVAATAVVPVICVPGGWEPGTQHHQVSVGVECTPASAPAIETAAGVAQVLGARVAVLHAWRPTGQYDAAISRRAVAGRWADETRPLLEELTGQVRAAHPDVKIDVELHYERPIVALHEFSEASDVLVIGRHGHHGRHGWPEPRLGTTARTVLRSSACPVLVVPQPIRD